MPKGSTYTVRTPTVGDYLLGVRPSSGAAGTSRFAFADFASAAALAALANDLTDAVDTTVPGLISDAIDADHAADTALEDLPPSGVIAGTDSLVTILPGGPSLVTVTSMLNTELPILTGGTIGLTDGTASHGKVSLTVGGFGPGVNLRSNSADANASVALTTLGGLTFGAGGAATADWGLARSGAATALLADGSNLATGGTTGSMLATTATQKLGRYGATPVVQRPSTTDLRQVLIDTGDLASGGANPLNLNGGAFTAASASLTGAAGLTVTDGTAGHGSIIATAGAFGPGISLRANSADAQAAVSVSTLGGIGFGAGGASAQDIAIQRSASLTLSYTDGAKWTYGTTTGVTHGTTTTGKQAWFNATPVVQQSSTSDLRTLLITYGFLATGGATPLNLNGGALTAASGSFTGASGVTVTDGTAGDGSTVITAGALGPGISLRANSGDAQAKVSLTTIGGLAFGAGGASAADISINRSASLTLSYTDGANWTYGGTTGTKHGTTTTGKQAWFNKNPIVQPTTSITAAAFVANSGTAVNDASTFGGYTLGKLAAVIINLGLAA